MDITRIDDKVSVSPQIAPNEMAAVAGAGFRSVICNRPDGEETGQPRQSDMQAAAHAAGLCYRYIPVVPGEAGPRDAAAFATAVAELPGPVLAYCRSGARASALYAASRRSVR